MPLCCRGTAARLLLLLLLLLFLLLLFLLLPCHCLCSNLSTAEKNNCTTT